MNVFEQKEGRHYRHFRNFLRDPQKNLNMCQLYQWISEHKKKFLLVLRLGNLNGRVT